MYYNDLPLFSLNETCAVTGHRILRADFDREKLTEHLENIIKSGFKNFLIGMAKGFDAECFLSLLSFKDEYDIKIVAVIPCLDQAETFNEKDKELYDELVLKADHKVILEEKYQKDCMLKRNDFLVNNSSYLFAYFCGRKKSGTYYTINRAVEKGIKIGYYGENI